MKTSQKSVLEMTFKYIKTLEELRIKDKLLSEMKRRENEKLKPETKACAQCKEVFSENAKLRHKIGALKKQLQQFSCTHIN